MPAKTTPAAKTPPAPESQLKTAVGMDESAEFVKF
jgi:hypothetical protein